MCFGVPLVQFHLQDCNVVLLSHVTTDDDDAPQDNVFASNDVEAFLH